MSTTTRFLVARHYENVIKEQIPVITTMAKISGCTDVYLSPAPFEKNRNPTIAVPKVQCITIPKAQVQSKAEISFSKPEIAHKVFILMILVILMAKNGKGNPENIPEVLSK